jgi:hypothetical protein
MILRRVGNTYIQEKYIHFVFGDHGLEVLPVNRRANNLDLGIHGKAVDKSVYDALMVVQNGDVDMR